MASLHLPYFVESLELTAFDLGTDLPTIPRIYPMYVNDWGIWLDFDLKYVGSIKLRIETSVNLFKLKYNDCLEQHPGRCYPIQLHLFKQRLHGTSIFRVITHLNWLAKSSSVFH